MNLKIIRTIYLLAATIVAGRFLSRCVQGFEKIPTENWSDFGLWQSLFSSFLIYSMCAGVAVIIFWKRKDFLSVPSLFLILLFGFYFLQLTNTLVFHVSEIILLRIVFFFMFLSAILMPKDERKPRNAPPQFELERVVIHLILLFWVMTSIFYFLEHNFSNIRQPYSDEVTLWYTAAQNILQQSAAFAHLVIYPGGGHPLGVPFIASLPAQIWNVPDPITIFFLPLVVIISLAMFVWQLRQQKWIFLFFILALFSSFNQREWVEDLMYRLVYATGISTVLFLLIVYELYKFSEKGDDRRFLGVAVLSGLAALSQSVFVLIIPILGILAIVTCGNFYSQGGSTLGPAYRQAGWKKGILFLLIAGFPYGVWKAVIAMHQGQSHEVSAIGRHLQENIFNPQWRILADIFQYMAEQAGGLHYFFIVSIVLILVSRDRKIIFTASAVFVYIGFILLFCVFRLASGSDPENALRYLMPASLALFYLGAQAYDGLIQKIEQMNCPRLGKYSLIVAMIALVMAKIF